jgi:probable HAF family extracellular repeat protein
MMVSMYVAKLAIFVMIVSTVVAAQNAASHHPQYRQIDIDTFGGPNSVYNGGTRFAASDGTIVGAANLDQPDLNAPDCFDWTCFVQHAWVWREGVVTDLEVLQEGYSSYTNAVNSRGLVVGQAQNDGIDPLTGGPVLYLATVWDHGRIKSLGTFGGGNSIAIAADDRNFVMGAAENGVPDTLRFPGFDGVSQIRGFGWSGGKIFDLGDLGGPGTFPSDMNNFGQIVGNSLTASLPGPFGVGPTAPFLWERGRMQNLGSLGGSLGWANAINNRGQVVGGSNLAGDQTAHPFLWERGKMQDLGTLGGDFGFANWLNEVGDVIGSSTTVGNANLHGFLWSHGTMTDLGTIGSDNSSNAFGINNRGQVIGQSWFWDGHQVTASHAFLYDRGGPMLDLNTLVSNPTELYLTEANYISDRGWIAANGVLPNGDLRAAILIPEDDDSGYAAVNAALAASGQAVTPTRASSVLTPQMKATLKARLMRGRYPASVLNPSNTQLPH